MAMAKMGTYKPAPSGLVSFVVVCCSVSMFVSTCAAELPDSPGGSREQDQAQSFTRHLSNVSPTPVMLLAQATPQPGSNSTPDAQSTNQTPNSQQPASSQQHQPPAQAGQKPVGTAAAESVPATGVAASQPAGTAIAPGKQRRTRSFVIKVGALVGAGVAIGTVAALSLGTSSKPPGAR